RCPTSTLSLHDALPISDATLAVMSTTERDYYELLGVSRDAAPDEIKRAFRKLARELHPDVSAEPDSELRFREIVEAYEVLSNTEDRKSTRLNSSHLGIS